MSRITTTILTSSLGMRHCLPDIFYLERFDDVVSDFLKAPMPQSLGEAYGEALQFANIIAEQERVSARGIYHFASERWNVRWLEDEIGNRRTLLPGGWSDTVDELVDATSETGTYYGPSRTRLEPQQPLLPFWGGERKRATGTSWDLTRTPAGNRFVLNTMLDMSHARYFDPLDCDDCIFDMRQSSEDTDLLLFGIVAKC